MSKIRLYGSTSGYVDLAAPAVADDATLTLPTGAAGFGKVLQVVSGTYSTQTSWTSAGYQDTGLSLSITPTSATSKVLVLVSQSVALGGEATRILTVRLVRDASTIVTVGAVDSLPSDATMRTVIPFTYVDSPATTSAVTYKTTAAINDATFGATGYAQIGSSASQITLLEVAA